MSITRETSHRIRLDFKLPNSKEGLSIYFILPNDPIVALEVEELIEELQRAGDEFLEAKR